MSINTPNNLEILIHFYCRAEPHPRADAPAVAEGIGYLRSNGLLDREDFPNVTPKGEFYLKHLLSVPFPVIKYEIPEVTNGTGI